MIEQGLPAGRVHCWAILCGLGCILLVSWRLIWQSRSVEGGYTIVVSIWRRGAAVGRRCISARMTRRRSWWRRKRLGILLLRLRLRLRCLLRYSIWQCWRFRKHPSILDFVRSRIVGFNEHGAACAHRLVRRRRFSIFNQRVMASWTTAVRHGSHVCVSLVSMAGWAVFYRNFLGDKNYCQVWTAPR